MMYNPLLPTVLLTLLSISTHSALAAIPDPIICEDTLDGSPPFDSRDVPCLLGCGAPVAVATGSLPGSVNDTDIPYCQLDCVRGDATPAQSAAAPDCRRSCGAMNQGTPENIGWCMYWCVAGYGDLVETTACVPSLAYGAEVTTTDGSWTVTYRPFTNPPAWQSWYQTQTVLPKSTTVQGGVVTMPSPSPTPTSTTSLISSIPSTTVPIRTESSRSAQETPTRTSTGTGLVGIESVLDAPTGGQSEVSPFPTGMGSRPSRGILLLALNIIGVLVLMM
ncbi:hypothetical protein F4818DRAFT_371961 [Hypoxylon cercidicola]|nr:hypothetical protein F4818DRAFT_371961 [Hypoxylon cercidicola]